MKRKSGSRSAFFNLRVLTVLLVFLAGIFLALFATANPPGLGFAAFSNAAAEGKGPPKTAASTADAHVSRGDLAFKYEPTRHLDEHGYRPSGPTFARPGSGKSRGAGVAGGGAWSLLGPPGGDVADAAVSTVDPNIVLAGIAPDSSFDGALYRSGDGGNTWSEVPALAGHSVYDIEFAAGGNAYIGTLDGVWKSSDGGLTWIAQNLGIGVNDQVLDVALDPSNPFIIWAGIADASGAQPVNVMRSTDGGATWTNRTPPVGQAFSCQAIAVDPGDSNTVVAVFGGAFGGGQVWVTTNGGSSWTNRSAGLPNNPMRAVVYDGTRLLVAGGQLFGSQNVGLYKSTNLGATWTPLHNASWPRRVVFDIAVDPNDSQTILVATDGTGVYRTADGGASWEIGIGGTGAFAGRSLRFRPGSSTELFLGTSSLAVFRSTDGGDTFVSSSRGISALTLFSIHANPLDPDELAVAFQGQNNGGVFSSTDGGVTWLLESAPPTRYSAVRFAPNGTLYAISSGPSTVAPEGLYRRETNGSWTPLGPDQGPLFESDLATMRFSVNNPALILLGGSDFGAAGSEGTIWRTTNAGQTWTKVHELSNSQPVIDIEIVEDGLDQVMLAACDDSGTDQPCVLRSTDGGVSWLSSTSGLPTAFLRGPHLCASTNDPQAFYMSAWILFGASSFFRTSDGGMTWASTGWTGNGYAEDVACHLDAELLFMTLRTLQSEGPQVVRSTDGGATFLPFGDGLEDVVNPRELAFAGYSRLLLASGKGSYRTELFGLPTPTPTATPTPTVNISGNVAYCPGSPRPVQNVTLNLTGSATTSTTTNGSGNYIFSSLASGGTYTVTPSRSNLPPGLGTNGINTADALLVQKHFLSGGTLLTGCALAAAHTNANNLGDPNTGDALFIQQFFLFAPNPLPGGNRAGQWRFSPVTRTYTGVNSNQTGQNYDAYALGDVNGDLTFPPPVNVGSGPSLPIMPMRVSVPVAVSNVALPNVDSSLSDFVAAVTTSNIVPCDKLVAFQGDFTFDSSVVTFQSMPVKRAGLTANGNWSLAANVLGTGTLKTLRVSCLALDANSVLSGEGPLFELRMTRVSSQPGASTQLIWAEAPNNFMFLDDNVQWRAPASTPPGTVTARPATGRR